MNQLSSEVKMTVKEISQITGISERTIQEHAKNMFPEIIQNGKTTYLNEAQATAIKFKVERSGRTDLANLFTISNIKTKTEKELIIFQAWGYINEKIENLKKNNSFDILLQRYSSEEIENALLTLQSILNISNNNKYEDIDIQSQENFKTKDNNNFVYIAKQTNENNIYKIGISKNINSRLKTFKTGNIFVEIIASRKTNFSREIESHLHKKLKKYKINGEWFYLEEKQIEFIIQNYLFNKHLKA